MVTENTQLLHDTFASLLYPFGDRFRQAEEYLAQLEVQPEFTTRVLELVLDSTVDIGVRRVAAVYLKNKITRSWSARNTPLSDADKYVFKSNILPAIIRCSPPLREFLIVCLSKIMDNDYQNGKWSELVPEVSALIHNTDNIDEITAGLRIIKQICKFYRWNLVKVNKQLDPLMTELFPRILSLAEAAITELDKAVPGSEESYACYEVLYEFLKIYKLSTTRFLPRVIREESIAKRTARLFLQVFVLPLPEAVANTQPASERSVLLPVKCQKWASGNIVRTHNNYLTHSYSQLSDNASAYAPYKALFKTMFAPEITRLYIERLRLWSERQIWYSDNVIHNIISFLYAMIDSKQVFTDIIEPQLSGLVGQVLFPLMCPTEDDLDLFEDDVVEFIQRQVDINDMLSPAYSASNFIHHIVRKRKQTLPIVMEFFEQCANKLVTQPDAVRERVGLFKLLQALEPIFSMKGSQYRASLEPILKQYVIPDLNSQHAYLRNEACNTINKMSSLKFESREDIQQLFEGVLNCFFDEQNLPVQVAAAQAMQSLSEREQDEDVQAALKQHITEIIRNLLAITQKIDLESMLSVLDYFVSQFPNQITPFAVDLAAQLCNQFISVASELAEAQRQMNEAGGGVVSESEIMMLASEKTSAGYGIMNSLANLQNNLEHQKELTSRLDEVIVPVFIAVYQHELIDFYPDCMSLHENTLFTLKTVPQHHWQYFGMLIEILNRTKFDFFEDAMPVLENYILYGSPFLAESTELLKDFSRLLITLYAPAEQELSEKAAVFAEARTRAHVMSVATKLLVSSGVFNGPLLPYVPDMINGVLARMDTDSRNAAATFPPRYNVAIVSVVLAGLYHNPEITLQVLQKNGVVNSFFETWFQSLPEFSRVNDLKLCVLTTLSFLSYQSTRQNLQVDQVFAQLIKALVHSLNALPAAASRVAEFMKSEATDLWDDDDELDFDAFDEELDEDYDDRDNDASADYADQMPEGSAVGGTGTSNFMYEKPGPTSDQNVDTTSANMSGNNSDVDQAKEAELRSQLVSQIGFISDDFDEDMYSVSPLDNLNPFDALRTVFSGLQNSNPPFYEKMMSFFSEADMAILNESLQRLSLPDYSLNAAK